MKEILWATEKEKNDKEKRGWKGGGKREEPGIHKRKKKKEVNEIKKIN